MQVGVDTGGTFTDTVTACGTDSFGHPNLCDTDDAVVTYSDVAVAPTLTTFMFAVVAARANVVPLWEGLRAVNLMICMLYSPILIIWFGVATNKIVHERIKTHQ